jgi:WD40 repeat protein
VRHHSRLHLERDGWRTLRLAFLSDDTLLACGWQPRDPLLRLWHMDADLLRAGGAPLRRMIDSGGPRLGAVALAPGGTLAACGFSPLPLEQPGPPCGRVWTLPRGRLAAALTAGDTPLPVLALAFTGADTLAAGHEGAVSLWSLASGARLALLTDVFSGPVTSLAAVPGLLAAAAESAAVRLWRLPDAAPLPGLEAARGVCALALSGDGRLLACATGTPADARRACEMGAAFASQVEVWALDGPRRMAVFSAGAPVCDLCFSPDGALLAAAAGDLFLWDVRAGALAARLHLGPGRGCTAAAFAPGGGLLAVGGTGGAVDVWALAQPD